MDADLTKLERLAAARGAPRHGMVFQHFNFVSSRTVYDNVALPLELAGMDKAAIRERVSPLLELVGLAALADRCPRRSVGGQKQHMSMHARCARAKVLLSDEAAFRHWAEATRTILDLLRQVNRELGLTVVLITRRMQVIKQVADRVAVISGPEWWTRRRVLDVSPAPPAARHQSLINEILPQELRRRAAACSHWPASCAPRRQGHVGQLLRLSYSATTPTSRCSRMVRE